MPGNCVCKWRRNLRAEEPRRESECEDVGKQGRGGEGRATRGSQLGVSCQHKLDGNCELVVIAA